MIRKALEVILKMLIGQLKGQFRIARKAFIAGLAVGGLLGLGVGCLVMWLLG